MMRFQYTYLALVILVAAVAAQKGKDCTGDSQCDDDHCCLGEFVNIPGIPTPGSCQPKRPDGYSCSIFDQLGSIRCGCMTGSSCKLLTTDPLTYTFPDGTPGTPFTDSVCRKD